MKLNEKKDSDGFWVFVQIFSESGDESQDEEKPETEVFPAEQNGGVSGTRKRTKIRSHPKFTVMPACD